MSDVLHAMQEEAYRRAAEIRAGSAYAPLAQGPVWIGRILYEDSSISAAHRSLALSEAPTSLLSLEPANTALHHVDAHGDGWLATSSVDNHGKHEAYAYLFPGGEIEMAGVLKVGPWMQEPRAWWPGIYELPLLRALSMASRYRLPAHEETPPAAPPLLLEFGPRRAAWLYMSLIAIAGTAVTGESGNGSEDAFPVPAGIDALHFAPVLLDGSAASRDSLITSFDRIRHLVGSKATAFYL
ncbi:hypothetical protein ACFPTO_18160 [Paraburkholderia denitrificans]|uniref:Uncharacterized protein n=1 Tax=Paraburkholderia denitrificans TaxID=694025 RepID=A0ABW0JCH6_9BURK